MADNKKTSLNDTIDLINKRFGDGSIIDGDYSVKIDRISTGSLGLDVESGGGLPIGRIVEIYGLESVGKTTICIQTMVEAQKVFPNKRVAIVDTEHALDIAYAENLGLKNPIISQPSTAEEAMEIAEMLIDSGEVSVLVVDSVAALVPKVEIEGEMGESKMGVVARLMSQAMRKLTAKIQKTDTLVIFTNQMREKIGVMFGSPFTTTGGNALKFYASLRIELRRKAIGGKDSEGDINHVEIAAKFVKNKTYPPYKEANYSIYFGEGICVEKEILDYGVKIGLIKKAGSWYSAEDIKLGQGADKVVEFLKDNPEYAQELKNKIKAHYGI